ncbi:MAG: hypothetical protein VR64_23740 [Desulfatitalea sp. BRH_c12]|nr:MAG: hypothetical protein VR64_23740 [Desulfatitalea sp. BRH_c12]
MAGRRVTGDDILYGGRLAPGRQIQDAAAKGGRVLLDGAGHAVRAGVHVLSGYSAHADRQGLLDWVAPWRTRPGRSSWCMARRVPGRLWPQICWKEGMRWCEGCGGTMTKKITVGGARFLWQG